MLSSGNSLIGLACSIYDDLRWIRGETSTTRSLGGSGGSGLFLIDLPLGEDVTNCGGGGGGSNGGVEAQ